jgi:hypothetical protein
LLIPKPVAARVAALRERRATLGLVRVEVWVRPEHAELVRRYAAQVAIAADIGPEPAMVRAIRNVTQHYRNLNAEFADPTPEPIAWDWFHFRRYGAPGETRHTVLWVEDYKLNDGTTPDLDDLLKTYCDGGTDVAKTIYVRPLYAGPPAD